MQNHNQLDLKSQYLMKDAKQRVAEQTKELLALIGSEKTSEIDKEKQWKLRGLVDHWWVQWQDKKGNWVDLDAIMPLLNTKTTVHDAPTVMTIEEIPEHLKHATNIRVIVETLELGKRKETIVLKQDIAPYKLLKSSTISITLSHIPSNMNNVTEFLKQKDKIVYLKSKLLKTEEWLPILTIDRGTKGKTNVIENRFTINGKFTKTSSIDEMTSGKSEPSKAISNSFGQMGGLLGGLSSEIGDIQEQKIVKDKLQKVITAEWIEYEIKVPGLETERIRRQIFDLIGPSARSAKGVNTFQFTDNDKLELGTALLGETEILSMANSVSPTYVATLTVDALLKNIKKIKELPTDQNFKIDNISQLATMPGATYSLALVRDNWRKTQNTVYLDRPNIITIHRGLHIKPTGTVSFNAFDIVYNHLAINDALAHNRFRLSLEQGVLDTNAEAIVLNELCQRNLPKDSCISTDNTAEQFFQSLTRGEKWIVINHKENRNHLLQTSTDIQTRINHALDEGYLVVFSSATERSSMKNSSSWWIIDSDTGRTLGIGSQGWGSLVVEKILITKTKIELTSQLYTLILATGNCVYSTRQSIPSVTLCAIGGLYGTAGFFFSKKYISCSKAG